MKFKQENKCYPIVHVISFYLFSGSYKRRLTTFPTRFDHDVSIMCYCHCSAIM